MSNIVARRHVLQTLLQQDSLNDKEHYSLQLFIQPPQGFINLRGDCKDEGFLNTCQSILRQTLPVEPNTVSTEYYKIYWLGPDEWLLVTPIEELEAVLAEMNQALSGFHHSLVNLSSGYLSMTLSGSHARDVLAKGSTIDFHPREFNIGQCVQTTLAKTNILIGMQSNEPAYDLLVRRSFAEYTMYWLKNATDEYGLKIISE